MRQIFRSTRAPNLLIPLPLSKVDLTATANVFVVGPTQGGGGGGGGGGGSRRVVDSINLHIQKEVKTVMENGKMPIPQILRAYWK